MSVAFASRRPPTRAAPANEEPAMGVFMKNSIMRSAALVALGAAGMGFAGQASAQDAAAAPTATGIEDIVITATKRETNLQNTPIAVSVIGGEAMNDRHADSLLALSDGAVPSLRIATFESRQSALTVGIRGIVPFDANQTARDIGVGVYLDGIYVGRPQGLNAGVFDVQRIEVLRGPQGTLFGRNTEGGAVSIVTKDPKGDGSGTLSTGVGNYGAYDGKLHYNMPEFANLSIKFDGLIEHQNATTKNPMEGQLGWNYSHRVGGRVAAKWTPTDRFTANAAFDIARDENTPIFSQLVNYNVYGKRVRTLAEVTAVANAPAGTINPLAALQQVHTERQLLSDVGAVQQASVNETGGLMLNLSYDVSPNLTLRSISGVRAVGTNQWDNAGVESRSVFAPNATFGRYSLSDLYQRQLSQEFQAIGNIGDSIEYVAGLYYFKEHVKEQAATPLTNQWNADGTAYTIRNAYGTPPNATAATGGWQYGTRFFTRASAADAESYAVFAQGTWTPASFDVLHLTAGGRYTHDQRDGAAYVVNNLPVNFPFAFEEDRFDPMVTVAFDAAENVHLYGKYSTGYRAGGANSRSATYSAFGSEEVKSFELGAKTQFLDNRVRFNVAAYHMDRDNTQIDFDNVDTIIGSPTLGAHTEETRNAAGVSKIDGVEIDATFRVTDGLTVGASYAYTKVVVPDAPFPFTGNNFIAVGVPFPVHVVYTPENAYSLFADFEQPLSGDLRVRAHLDANYADAQHSFQTEFADVSATAVQFQNVSVMTDSSFIVNGSIALAGIKAGNSEASLSLWSRNLLDEEHIYRISASNRGTIGDYANFNPPRTFGVELSLDF
jgi:iron complex outermembrane receptor protein